MAQTAPGLCLFCYKNDGNDDPFQRGTVGESSTIHGKFFNIFQRYWNCTRGGSSIEEFTKEDVLQKEVLACCWECFTILDTFCRAFERWTSLKLELDGLLETLGISIASADNIPWMVNTFNDRYVECPEALEKLASCRDHLKGLCRNVRITSLPRVNLPRVDEECDTKDAISSTKVPKVEVKLEPLDEDLLEDAACFCFGWMLSLFAVSALCSIPTTIPAIKFKLDFIEEHVKMTMNESTSVSSKVNTQNQVSMNLSDINQLSIKQEPSQDEMESFQQNEETNLQNNDEQIPYSSPATNECDNQEGNQIQSPHERTKVLKRNMPDVVPEFIQPQPIQNDHPLLNPQIIAIICEHLPVVDLRQVRLVCKTWYENSLKHWRPNVTIRIGPPVSPRFINLTEETTPLEWPNLLCRAWDIEDYFSKFQNPDDFCQLVKFPYNKYIFKGFYMGWEKEETSTINSDSFWKLVGPHMSKVRFEDCTFSQNRPELFESIVVNMLNNLQSLNLLHCSTFPQKAHVIDKRILDHSNNSSKDAFSTNTSIKTLRIVGETPMCPYALLISCPNIETLQFSGSGTNQSEVSGGLEFFLQIPRAQHILKAINPTNVLKVKHLDVMDLDLLVWFNPKNHWQEINFPLESLSLGLSNHKAALRSSSSYEQMSENEKDIETGLLPALQQHAETLKVLKVCRPPIRAVPVRNPFQVQMTNLNELYLWGNVVGNLNFLINLPNLQVLHVDPQCHDKLDMFKRWFSDGSNNGIDHRFQTMYRPNASIPLISETIRRASKLEKMERVHLNVILNGKAVEALAEFMPNLKSLQAVLWRDGFRAVCKRLANLEELMILFGSRIGDDTFTGLAGLDETKRRDNITSLKHLKRFHLKNLCCEWGNPFESSRLGDKSIYRGFLEIDGLEHVTVCASETMTKGAEEALKRHVKNVEIIRNYGNHRHPYGDCCRVAKFSKDILNYT